MKTTTVFDFYYNKRLTGDKKIVYRTELTKMYPYPIFEGEKYVSLSYKYRLIDQTYKMAVLDEILCNVEYQPDGSSNTMWRQYLKNPRGWAFWRKVCMQYPISKRRLIMDCIHYCSSCFLYKNKNYISDSPRKVLTICCSIPGWFLSLCIRRKAK